MNHLAHFYLSFDENAIAVGNFLADFVTRKETGNLSPELQQGISLHRKIDDFTDRHNRVRKSIRWLHPHFGKYSPVILDIYYDYLLTKNWDTYVEIPLASFCERIYKLLISYQPHYPVRLSDRIKSMVRYKWLESFGSYTGLQNTFNRLNKRIRYPADFSNASQKLHSMEVKLDTEFNLFFPDAIEFVKHERGIV